MWGGLNWPGYVARLFDNSQLADFDKIDKRTAIGNGHGTARYEMPIYKASVNRISFIGITLRYLQVPLTMSMSIHIAFIVYCHNHHKSLVNAFYVIVIFAAWYH